MKFLKTIWAILPFILACVVYFGYARVLPTFVKVALLVLFIIVWLCRKQIAETIISKLKHVPVLDHFMWDDASQKQDENGKITQERKPIESNIKLIKLGVSAAILLVLLGIPMLIYGIFALLGSIVGIFTNAFETVLQDLSFVNGTGFFIFAIFEILVTLAAIAAVVFAIIKNRKGDWDAKTTLLVSVGAFLVQRIMSWFYFGVGVGGAIGEILFWAILIGTIWIVVKFDIINKIRTWFRSRGSHGPSTPDSSDSDSSEGDGDGDDFIDPIG